MEVLTARRRRFELIEGSTTRRRRVDAIGGSLRRAVEERRLLAVLYDAS